MRDRLPLRCMSIMATLGRACSKIVAIEIFKDLPRMVYSSHGPQLARPNKMELCSSSLTFWSLN